MTLKPPKFATRRLRIEIEARLMSLNRISFDARFLKTRFRVVIIYSVVTDRGGIV
jgi:hypothetical protein